MSIAKYLPTFRNIVAFSFSGLSGMKKSDYAEDERDVVLRNVGKYLPIDEGRYSRKL
jgi:hypothetical protein